VGRFNIETFIVAQPPAGQPAPVVHNQPPFPDASSNPATEPIHTFHLGLWFGSPLAAQAAGCPNTITRFNGDHTAGIQALSTRTFPTLQGPLRQLTPWSRWITSLDRWYLRARARRCPTGAPCTAPEPL